MRFLAKSNIPKGTLYGEFQSPLPVTLGNLRGLEDAGVPIHVFLCTPSKIRLPKLIPIEPAWIYKVRDLDVEDAFEYYVVGIPSKSALNSVELDQYYVKIQKFLRQNYVIVNTGDSHFATKILKSFIIKEAAEKSLN